MVFRVKLLMVFKVHSVTFPDSSVGQEFTCNAGDPSWTPGSERSPGEGIGYPLTAAMKLKDAYSLEEK